MPSATIGDVACRSLHISRVLLLPPLAAQSAVGDHDDAPGNGEPWLPSRPWVLLTDSARLSLVGSGRLVRHTDLCPYRRWFGSLGRRDRQRSVPVEVELTPWSTTTCELGLRPSGRGARLADSRWRRRWFSLGLEVVEALATTMEQTSWQGIVRALEAPDRTRITT